MKQVRDIIEDNLFVFKNGTVILIDKGIEYNIWNDVSGRYRNTFVLTNTVFSSELGLNMLIIDRRIQHILLWTIEEISKIWKINHKK